MANWPNMHRHGWDRVGSQNLPHLDSSVDSEESFEIHFCKIAGQVADVPSPGVQEEMSHRFAKVYESCLKMEARSHYSSLLKLR